MAADYFIVPVSEVPSLSLFAIRSHRCNDARLFVCVVLLFLCRTSYSFVSVARSWVPNLLGHIWLCQYAPVHSSYTPMYVASERLPLPFIRGAMQVSAEGVICFGSPSCSRL